MEQVGESGVDGEGPDLLAGAAQPLVAVGLSAIGGRQGGVDGAHGLVLGAARGSGDAADGEGVGAVAAPARAIGHGLDDFGADGTEVVEQGLGDVQEPVFGVVGVGEIALMEVGGAAGDGGDHGSQESGGAGFGDAEGGAIVGEEAAQSPGERFGVIANKPGSTVGEDQVAGVIEAMGVAADGEVDHREVGAKADAEAEGLELVDGGLQAVGEIAFAEAKEAKTDLVGGVGVAFGKAVIDEPLKFRGHAGKEIVVGTPMVESKASGRTGLRGEDGGLGGELALAAMALGELAAARLEMVAQLIKIFGGKDEVLVDEIGGGLAGAVIMGGAESTADHDDVRSVKGIEGVDDAGASVIDEARFPKVESLTGAPLAQVGGVGVADAAVQ